jgi:molybdate/tungstate transport system substrate-binding protein
MRRLLTVILIATIVLTGCNKHKKNKESELIIFHAGSLAVPMKRLSEEFEKTHPGVKVLSEAAGSLVCARKITELKQPCDILLSADYFVIDKMLIPDYATWNIKFATNEIVVAYRDKSKYSSDINSLNWFNILMRPDVIYGRSDPNSDPCGYRSVFTASLAGDYYKRPGLTDSLLGKDRNCIRPKEVDLVALLQTGVVDYIFQYKSVAIQHNLKFVDLPDEINLSDIGKKKSYSNVSVLVPGSEPGKEVRVDGDYICYGGTILTNAPDKELALDFFNLMLSKKGQEILGESGQDPLIPAMTDQPGDIPETLIKYFK